MADELLPCPFCGSTRIEAREGSTFRWIEAWCCDCEARCGEVRKSLDEEISLTPSLIASWNARATPSDAAVREWQDIETAPKDGTRILVVVGGRTRVGYFGPKYSTYGVNYGDAWGYGSNWHDSFTESPEVWQPLPAPPVARTGEEK